MKERKHELTCELLAVDRLAAGAIVASEITTLEHKVGDNTVEGRAGVSEPVLDI